MSQGRTPQHDDFRCRGMLAIEIPCPLNLIPGGGVLRIGRQPCFERRSAFSFALCEMRAPGSRFDQCTRLNIAHGFRPYLLAKCRTAFMTCFSTVLCPIP